MKSYFFLLFLFLFVSFDHQDDNEFVAIKKTPTLHLKWNKAYADDTIDKSVIGLKWGLSYIGAKLPKTLNGIVVTNDIISIDINQLGFSELALEKLDLLHSKIVVSDEYLINNSIDLGRYVSLLLGASEHYYEISGTPKTLTKLLSNYTLLPQKGYVTRSTVSLTHRSIQFSEQNGFNQLFVSQELDSISGSIYEYETIELLENGQLRFGIFDSNGNRKNSADASHSNAGKPAKCMWCHESVINQMFIKQNDFPNYLPFSVFQNTLITYRSSHHNLKTKLTDGVDFTQIQQHTLTELLYITFMEPSAERLSIEWNISLVEVKKILKGLPTHTHEEHLFLGDLFDRSAIENLAPYKGIVVSSSVREKSEVEVNHLN